MVVAVAHGDLGVPRTIVRFAHGEGGGIPVIKVAGNENFLCFGGNADEINGFDRLF